MGRLLGNSSMPNYIKLMAACLLSVTYLAALGLAVQSYIVGGPDAQLPTVVSFIIGTGLGVSLQVLGLHQGAQLAEKNGGQ
jgi:biotin transporter BioY